MGFESEGGMAVFLTLGTMLAMIGYYVFVLAPVMPVAKDAPAADVVAAAMLVYQKAAVEWCLRTSCPDGTIPAGSMILPPGFSTASWLSATAEGGRVSTFAHGVNVSAKSIVGRLGDLTGGGPSAGLAVRDQNGRLVVSARNDDGATRRPVIVAAGVAVNVPVVSQKVK
jgi:hypothetical protein